jgi:hypothetical protein
MTKKTLKIQADIEQLKMSIISGFYKIWHNNKLLGNINFLKTVQRDQYNFDFECITYYEEVAKLRIERDIILGWSPGGSYKKPERFSEKDNSNVNEINIKIEEILRKQKRYFTKVYKEMKRVM